MRQGGFSRGFGVNGIQIPLCNKGGPAEALTRKNIEQFVDGGFLSNFQIIFTTIFL